MVFLRDYNYQKRLILILLLFASIYYEYTSFTYNIVQVLNLNFLLH